MSCATPKTCSPGVRFRVRNTAPIHTGQGVSAGCVWGCFLEVFRAPHCREVHGEVLLNAAFKAYFGVLRSGSQLQKFVSFSFLSTRHIRTFLLGK